MVEAAKKVSSKHQDLLERCMAVSSTCFRDTAAYLDENYKVLRPSIIWLDQRFARGTKNYLLFIEQFILLSEWVQRLI